MYYIFEYSPIITYTRVGSETRILSKSNIRLPGGERDGEGVEMEVLLRDGCSLRLVVRETTVTPRRRS